MASALPQFANKSVSAALCAMLRWSYVGLYGPDARESDRDTNQPEAHARRVRAWTGAPRARVSRARARAPAPAAGALPYIHGRDHSQPVSSCQSIFASATRPPSPSPSGMRVLRWGPPGLRKQGTVLLTRPSHASYFSSHLSLFCFHRLIHTLFAFSVFSCLPAPVQYNTSNSPTQFPRDHISDRISLLYGQAF